MAKVLIFDNFLQEGQKSSLQPPAGARHEYTSVGPGRWQANPYGKRKHGGLGDLFRRFAACVSLARLWRRYDVLIVDRSITGLLVGAVTPFRRDRRKLVVSSFNVLRHRGRLWDSLAGVFYRKIDHFFVHSRYDIDLVSKLYGVPPERVSFRPYQRQALTEGMPDERYLFEDRRPYLLSFGSNARDYRTLLDAVRGTDLALIVVARDYNLQGLSLPENVKAFTNIPLEQCDRLVHHCLFAVFTFDGSEPSCGQISIVSSLMAGKPVVCTDCTGVHDYVTPGENGLLVKIRDSADLRARMLELAHDGRLRETLAAGARRWAAENADPQAVHSMIDAFVTRLTAR